LLVAHESLQRPWSPIGCKNGQWNPVYDDRSPDPVLLTCHFAPEKQAFSGDSFSEDRAGSPAARQA
jgi:hypothetical protein